MHTFTLTAMCVKERGPMLSCLVFLLLPTGGGGNLHSMQPSYGTLQPTVSRRGWSQLQHDECPPKADVFAAALHILDALENKIFHPYPSLGPWARGLTRLHRTVLTTTTRLALLGLLVLAFYEKPTWCKVHPTACDNRALYPR